MANCHTELQAKFSADPAAPPYLYFGADDSNMALIIELVRLSSSIVSSSRSSPLFSPLTAAELRLLLKLLPPLIVPLALFPVPDLQQNNSSKAHHINFVYGNNSSLIFHHLSILKGDLLTVDCLRASSSALVDELCRSCSVFKNLKSVDPVFLFFFTEDLSSTIDRTSAPENSPLENSFLALAVIKHPWDPVNANSHFGTFCMAHSAAKLS